MRYTFTLLASLTLFLTAKAQTNAQIKDFDSYVEKAVSDWEAPGLAVIVVKDNKIIFQKGYGVLQQGKPAKVNTKTMFACASTTKAITAMCAAILVDEGKLHWDDKVTDYLPDFQLFDPYVTREITVRDLFLHDSGVGNTDFLWSAMSIPSTEVLRRLRYVKPEYGFRAGFAYQNIFYLAAGKVIEKAAGIPWEEFIRKRIYEPLGMIRTVPLIKYTKGMSNLATPHFRIDSAIQVIKPDTADNIGPAGGMWSCVEDMGKWVKCMLDSSKYGNGKTRLVKPETWAYLLKPRTFVTETEFYPTAKLTHPHWETYGMGWFQQDYKGQKIDFHTGSLNGFVAINGLMVDQHLGIYILANLDHAEVRHALMFKAFDTFAVGGDTDWSTDFLKLYKSIKEKRAKAEKEALAKRVTGTKPSLPLSGYTGKYTDPLYGEVNVTAVNDALLLDINHVLKVNAAHWHYDSFYGDYSDKTYGKAGVSFTLDPFTGKVATINVDGMILTKAD